MNGVAERFGGLLDAAGDLAGAVVVSEQLMDVPDVACSFGLALPRAVLDRVQLMVTNVANGAVADRGPGGHDR